MQEEEERRAPPPYRQPRHEPQRWVWSVSKKNELGGGGGGWRGVERGGLRSSTAWGAADRWLVCLSVLVTLTRSPSCLWLGSPASAVRCSDEPAMDAGGADDYLSQYG